jgi:hypothetical protein
MVARISDSNRSPRCMRRKSLSTRYPSVTQSQVSAQRATIRFQPRCLIGRVRDCSIISRAVGSISPALHVLADGKTGLLSGGQRIESSRTEERLTPWTCAARHRFADPVFPSGECLQPSCRWSPCCTRQDQSNRSELFGFGVRCRRTNHNASTCVRPGSLLSP